VAIVEKLCDYRTDTKTNEYQYIFEYQINFIYMSGRRYCSALRLWRLRCLPGGLLMIDTACAIPWCQKMCSGARESGATANDMRAAEPSLFAGAGAFTVHRRI
jgi:hypothetical protein